MNYITKLSVTMHAQGLIKCALHNLIVECLEQLQLKGLTNIVKMQDIIVRKTRSNSITPKENKNIKKFSSNIHSELTQ